MKLTWRTEKRKVSDNKLKLTPESIILNHLFGE